MTPTASCDLEHDPENACPGLDPGWVPVFGKDHAPPIVSRRRLHGECCDPEAEGSRYGDGK